MQTRWRNWRRTLVGDRARREQCQLSTVRGWVSPGRASSASSTTAPAPRCSSQLKVLGLLCCGRKVHGGGVGLRGGGVEGGMGLGADGARERRGEAGASAAEYLAVSLSMPPPRRRHKAMAAWNRSIEWGCVAAGLGGVISEAWGVGCGSGC